MVEELRVSEPPRDEGGGARAERDAVDVVDALRRQRRPRRLDVHEQGQHCNGNKARSEAAGDTGMLRKML